MQVLAEEYAANTMAPDVEDGRMAAADDLLAIENIFEQIGEMFDRIETFRRQLEARVRNTIKYAERGTQGLVGRAGDLVRRLDALLRDGRHDEATVEWNVEPLRSPWSEHHQAPTRQPRRPVEARELAAPPSDPLYELRKQLRLEYIARIAPRPEDVRRFLEGQVSRFGTKEARRGQDGQSETEHPDHSASLGDSTTSSTRIRLSVHTGSNASSNPGAMCLRRCSGY